MEDILAKIHNVLPTLSYFIHFLEKFLDLFGSYFGFDLSGDPEADTDTEEAE